MLRYENYLLVRVKPTTVDANTLCKVPQEQVIRPKYVKSDEHLKLFHAKHSFKKKKNIILDIAMMSQDFKHI